MDRLPHRHLTTLTLAVDFPGILAIGKTLAGHRAIAPITGGRFEGERLSGEVLPGGSDWLTTRAGGFDIDVRLALRSDDGANLAMSYRGRFLADDDTMRRFRQGEQIERDSYSVQVVARFESGDERYAWLNDAIVVGVGEQTPSGPRYTIFEIAA
ncbi:DUF3237 domain-containing protein [Sphingomonas sp.]|uniref:DUF3237 domain-containing protein n=1 Tax=Sphingomonas sp. TaxID=28214 RepID=UPI00286DC587|nr:DUF3237 domain-containing protein [Sphingomonas sp.]